MLNLDTLALAYDHELHLRHPVTEELLYDGDDKNEASKVSIHILGSSSKEYRDAISALQTRQLKRGKKQASPELLREEATKILVACSVSTKNLAYKGEPVQRASQFEEMYSDPRFSWLREQVDAALGDVANFLTQ
jgi:hypothetical protein